MPKLTALVLALMAPFLFAGCFSSVVAMGNNLGDGATGSGTSTSLKVGAAAADVVTLPLQAPFYALNAMSNAKHQEAVAKDAAYLEQIKKDPEFIFQHNLQTAKYDEGYTAVRNALADKNVPFTDAQLRRLYREMLENQGLVLQNPHCSVAFLKEIWDPINEKKKLTFEEPIGPLLANPSTPSEWLQTVVDDPHKYGAMSNWAKGLLRERDHARANLPLEQGAKSNHTAETK